MHLFRPQSNDLRHGYGARMGDERLDGVLASLRDAGTRVTGPRRAVIAALAGSDGHLSAADLSEVVQAANPEVHQSTVYRTLDRLVELGVVEHIHVAHGPAVYHLTHDHHIHLVCDRCGVVIDAPAAVLASAAAALSDGFGFRMAVGHVALTGRCADCQVLDLTPHPDAVL